LFRPELSKIINPGHGLVKLAKAVNWDHMNELFGKTYCSDNGRPGVSTRLMVSLHYLKYTHNLSDDDVVSAWVENPHWQHLSGMKFFEYEPLIKPSIMSCWPKRIGEAGAEVLLKETIAAGLRLKAVKPYQLKRVNVDTTVQEKDIRLPTDARLCDRARPRLVKAAKEHNIELRQNYNRNSKHLLAKQSRYAHARQMNVPKDVPGNLGLILAGWSATSKENTQHRILRYNHFLKSVPEFFINAEKIKTRSTVSMSRL
jgi:transposase, IS5 family